MAATNDDGGGDANPYLAMREAKIARNEKRLRELGLLKPPQPPAAAAAAAMPRTKRSEMQKTILLIHNGPVRRSSRISLKTKPDYKDVSLPSESGTQQPAAVGRNRKRPRSPVLEPDDQITSSTFVVAKRAPSRKSSPSTPAANSVRSIDLDVKTLVLGKDRSSNDNNGLLGKIMEHTGKEFIINESFSLAASAEDQLRLSNTMLSFNKYCGVQEWKNAIFLWVNLGTGDSPNEFLEDASRVTWFGGSRMHDDSPVVHKLINYGKEASGSSVTKDEDEKKVSDIVLWCRRYQPEIKKFSPYACFGRMGYRSHMPGSRPLSFVWDLLDRDGLINHDDPAVREMFEAFTK